MAEEKTTIAEVGSPTENRRSDLGDKRCYSETALNHVEESTTRNRDPGVFNGARPEERSRRKRTVSQPGPVVSTAASSRARRKPRNVMYADQHNKDTVNEDAEDKFSFRLVLPNSQADSGTATPVENTSSHLPNVNYGNGDSKSLNSYRLFSSCGDLRAGTTRRRSVAEVQSERSVETQAPPPTAPEEKSAFTRMYLTIMLSVMYAILLVTLGTTIFVSDPFITQYSVSPIYCLFLVGVGYLYLIYLLIDIRLYLNKEMKNNKVKEKHLDHYEDYYKKQELEVDMIFSDGTTNREQPLPPPPPPTAVLKHFDHNYCFSHGRHAGSFYLKMGAAGFALGHMVHSVLLLASQLSYVVEDGYEDCLDYPQLVLDVVYPIYSFFQLFFIFKYSNIIILRGQRLAHFGFMHFIGSSLCFWVWTICRETVLALTIYAYSRYFGTENNYQTTSSENITHIYTPPLRFSLIDMVNEECMEYGYINTIFSNFSPYLFPFTVEYNILIVAIFYIIWSNIGNHNSDEEDDDVSSIYSGETVCKTPFRNDANGFSSNFVIHADCHASNRGIFAGLIVVVFTLALVILTFIFANLDMDDFFEVSHVMSDVTKLCLHAVMLIAVVVAYNQTRQLDVNQHPVSLLDDILLFICIPTFFMETIFTMVATISVTNFVKCVNVLVMSLQAIVQTSFLVDGLRRCSNTRRLRRVKPGRELVMFLLICNVAIWIFYTFSYKSPDTVDERYEFYGKILWTVLGHISLPLIMFYRFHSSVCFADIWKSAYEPGSAH